MPTLFVFIPFNQHELSPTKDLPLQANELYLAFQAVSNKRIGENIGALISSVQVVYLDSQFTVTNQDYIIVFAHGSKDAKNWLFSNVPPLEIKATDAMNVLIASSANKAVRILFMCCFSSLDGHIGQLWEAKYPNQTIYAGNAAISNLFSATRTQIRSCCLALFELSEVV
ncbi:hypothetical protein [Chitinophaga nivalis]|uniref:CHAT domain-containing protein n=1 Tax=Chitinophaga nivalis TaxID=2991709 RepID=A0ABT3INL0_9BACT|nr:hypothetical protein [Chitinophaga nivalis]MCW3464737.1 hypothetical protein [Chitinophaga nivalis]MCW3485572.1 hypothetical protein [Chitinophaga nivalis]